MKIYPKTRKFQSGGKLSEINFYPTVQYTPTSSVAITQGAWSPLQQTRTKDALLDPELMKGKEMLSNESREYMGNLESKMYKYNNLSEPERQSNKGLSLLASMKGDSAKAVEYVNNYKRNQEAVKSLEPNDSSDIWVTDEYGRHGVKDLQDANKVKWINSVDLYENLNRFKPLSALELTTARGEVDAEVRNTRLDDIAKRTTGRKIWDESLARAATNIGHNQVNSIIQGRYGITPKDDGLNKTRKIERGSLDNKYQIAAASDLALNQMPASDKNGIMATAVQKLFNPNNMGDYIETRSFGYNPKTGKTEIQFGRKSFGEVLEQLEGYSKDKNGKVIKTPVPPEEKFKIIENFKRDYLKTYVKNYFDAKTVDENKYSNTFDVASEDINERMGIENALKKTETTYDAKAVMDEIVARSTDHAMTTSPNDLFATIYTKKFTPLEKSGANTVGIGKTKMLDQNWEADPKNNYVIKGTTTLGGPSIDNYSKGTQNNIYRIDDGHTTRAFYTIDAQSRKVYSLNSSLVNESTGNKWIDDINHKIEEVRKEHTKKGVYDENAAENEFSQYLEKNDLSQLPSMVFKSVVLVPLNTDNQFDKDLIKSGSHIDRLDAEQKAAFLNKMSSLNSVINTKREELYPTNLNNGSVSIDKKNYNVQTVKLNGVDYAVTVKEITGVSADPAVISNIGSTHFNHGFKLYNIGDRSILMRKFKDMMDKFESTGVILKYGQPQIETKEKGGIIPQFTPIEFTIKPLSLKDLY